MLLSGVIGILEVTAAFITLLFVIYYARRLLQKRGALKELRDLEGRLTNSFERPKPKTTTRESIDVASQELNRFTIEAKSLMASQLDAEQVRVNNQFLYGQGNIALGHIKSHVGKLLGEVRSYRVRIEREGKISTSERGG